MWISKSDPREAFQKVRLNRDSACCKREDKATGLPETLEVSFRRLTDGRSGYTPWRMARPRRSLNLETGGKWIALKIRRQTMHLLLLPVLGSVIWIGGGGVGLVIIIIIVVLLVR